MKQVRKVSKTIINISSIIVSIITCIIAFVIMKISLNEENLKVIFYQVLPILLLGIYTVMSATYYYAIIRGLRDFKFLAIRNFVSSLIKIIVATILAYTPLGIIGVWISYLIYCILQNTKFIIAEKINVCNKYV